MYEPFKSMSDRNDGPLAKGSSIIIRLIIIFINWLSGVTVHQLLAISITIVWAMAWLLDSYYNTTRYHCQWYQSYKLQYIINFYYFFVYGMVYPLTKSKSKPSNPIKKVLTDSFGDSVWLIR